MNPDWLDFLQTQQALLTDDNQLEFPNSEISESGLYPLTSLGALKVSGVDATQFLQGQLTCNVNELNPQNSFFAAMCNPKGRVISTLLIFKQQDDFLLVLPVALLEKVHKKLKMYVMRSKVILENMTEEFCVTGLNLDTKNFSLADKDNIIQLPNSETLYLIVASVNDSISLWKELQTESNYPAQNSDIWKGIEIQAGLPWLNSDSSEAYIPQMLNIDTLGGISFNKGCYIGQEVVARTHYLGKAKRTMFVATTETEDVQQALSVINTAGYKVGEVLEVDIQQGVSQLLIVMQTEAAELPKLHLDNSQQTLCQLA